MFQRSSTMETTASARANHRTIESVKKDYAGVAELAYAVALGATGHKPLASPPTPRRPCRFESCRPHSLSSRPIAQCSRAACPARP